MAVLSLSDTQYDFVTSPATVVWLIGPQGEGKTFAAVMGMIAERRKYTEWDRRKALRVAIVRDTHENIKRHTVSSIREALETVPGLVERYHFSNDYKKLTGPGIDADLLGIADAGALSKLQGGQYGLVWIEEPAPIVEKANSGIAEDVFDVALGRCMRQTDTTGKLFITMNPADEDHWTYHKAIEDPINPINEPLTYPKISNITTQVFNIPYGENSHLSNNAREGVMAGYKDREDLYARFVRGAWSYVQLGESVVPEYSSDLHRTKVRLDPLKGIPVYRFWDAGLNPTCVFYQRTPRGFVHFIDTLVGDNMGMRQFVRNHVKPMIARRYNKVEEWYDIGDPNTANREQADSEVTAASIIEKELNTTFIGGPDRWEPRREAVKEVFSRMIDGEPMVKVSCHEGVLHRALRGGWHYKKDNSGNILRDKPIKNMHSHPGDAISYGIAFLHPWSIMKKPKRNYARSKQIAQSYAPKRGRKLTSGSIESNTHKARHGTQL